MHQYYYNVPIVLKQALGFNSVATQHGNPDAELDIFDNILINHQIKSTVNFKTLKQAANFFRNGTTLITTCHMTWTYQNQTIDKLPDDAVGFVYLITNTVNGKMYVGKKLAKFAKTTYKVVKLKNGNKKRKKIKTKIDSDWQQYYGSSPNLTEDINQLGTDNFKREILYYCKSRSECSYIEAREQFSRRVLESDDYYNGHIQVRVHGSHIKNKL